MRRKPKIKSGRLRTRPKCLGCKATVDGWTGIGRTRPKPGDVTLCAYCGTAMFYTDKLGLRTPTEEEEAMLQAHPKFGYMQAVVLEMMARRVSGTDGGL